MFKGFFIGYIVRPCPKLFDPIFAFWGSKLGQFDPLNKFNYVGQRYVAYRCAV